MTEELEKANDALINMAHTAMTDKEQIIILTRTLSWFTKRFVYMEENLYRVIAVQTRAGASAGTHTYKKDLVGTTYWQADDKHIWDQVGYCWSHGYCMKPARNSTTCNQLGKSQCHKEKAKRKENVGVLSWVNPKI